MKNKRNYGLCFENVKLMSSEEEEKLKSQQILERAVREKKSMMMIEDKIRCAIVLSQEMTLIGSTPSYTRKGFLMFKRRKNFLFHLY